MNFEEVLGVGHLVNSDGYLLRLLYTTGPGVKNEDIFIESACKNNMQSVLCKINYETLKLYLNGRLRTKELFLVRCHEKFLVRTDNSYESKDFSSEFKANYIKELVYGNFFYYDIEASTRSYADTKEILNKFEEALRIPKNVNYDKKHRNS